MKKFSIEMLGYTLFTIALCLIIGGALTGCTEQKEPKTASPESYFMDEEQLAEEARAKFEIEQEEAKKPYDPCKDSNLKYEKSEESDQRREQCKKLKEQQ